MKTSSCDTAFSLIVGYESLTAAEEQSLAQHVASCAHCRAQFEAVQQVGDRLMEDALGEMPAALTDKIMTALGSAATPLKVSRRQRATTWLTLIIGTEIALLFMVRSLALTKFSHMVLPLLDIRSRTTFVVGEASYTMSLLGNMLGNWGAAVSRSLTMGQLMAATLICLPLVAIALFCGKRTDNLV